MTRKLPPAERRETIIDAAIEEFVDKGYERSSMDAIARRAGISKGGVYHHFPGKGALLAAANERIAEPVTRILGSFTESESALHMLESYIRSYLQHWADNEDKLAFVFLSIAKSLRDPALFTAYEHYIALAVDGVESIYRRGVDQGVFDLPPARQRALALALCAALDGVTLYLPGRALDIRETMDGYIDVFVNALRRVTP